MVDYSEAEVNGILAVFPNSEVYLCEFQREQAWTRWIRNSKEAMLHIAYIALCTCTLTADCQWIICFYIYIILCRSK